LLIYPLLFCYCRTIIVDAFALYVAVRELRYHQILMPTIIHAAATDAAITHTIYSV